jgi:site-specific recombinase XerD
MDVRSAVDAFLAAKYTCAASTRRGHAVRLGIFAAWCEAHSLTLEQLTARALRQFVEDVGKRPGLKGSEHLASSTVHWYGASIKAFLTWCARDEEFEDLVSTKTFARLPLPRADSTVIETFSVEQLQALLRATDKQLYAQRDKAIVAVLLDTGIRAAELCGLVLKCVWLDTDDSYIRVVGKGRKEREVPLGRAARIALRRYITRYRHPKDQAEQHVFIARGGTPLTVQGLRQVIEQLGERTRIRDVRVSPHTFRHTFAVQFLLNGGDIYKLSRLMGHTSVKITERYLQAVSAKQARSSNHSVLDNL